MKVADTPTSKSPVLLLHWGVLEEVIRSIGGLRAESGGAIGGNGDDTEVSHYHFDESSRKSAVTYSPDYKLLNRMFKSEWNPAGIRLRGFIHSHPGRMNRPSYGDEVYAERILDSIEDIEFLWLPIVNTVPDTGEFRLTPWAACPAERGVSVVRGRVQVVHASGNSSLQVCGETVLEAIKTGVVLDEIVVSRAERSVSRGAVASTPTAKNHAPTESDGRRIEQSIRGPTTIEIDQPESTFDVRDTFNRVEGAYDLTLMRGSRITAVGVGGAASWLEELARAGVGAVHHG